MADHPKRLAPADLKRGLWVALLAALVFSVFHFFGCTDIGYDARIATSSAFVWLWRRWMGELGESPLAPGPWIPLLFLLFLWSRRRELRSKAGRANAWGLVVLILALVCHWVGARAQQTRLSLGAFAMILWAIPFYCGGRAVARQLLFPCLFLLLAMPLNFLDRVVVPLRGSALWTGQLLLGGVGVEAVRSGSQLRLGADHALVLDLADPGAGIHALIALLVMALAAGYLMRKTIGVCMALAMAAPVAFILGNVVRILIFGLSSRALDQTGNVVPRWSVWIQFASALCFLGLVPLLWRRVARWAFGENTDPKSGRRGAA